MELVTAVYKLTDVFPPTERNGLTADPDEGGGMSGRPLWPLARARIGTAVQATSGRVPVIGCGGIHSVQQARELLDLGCVAVQLYSALIFEGPGLIHRLNRGLATS